MKESVTADRSQINTVRRTSGSSLDDVTDRFRELLLHGRKKVNRSRLSMSVVTLHSVCTKPVSRQERLLNLGQN